MLASVGLLFSPDGLRNRAKTAWEFAVFIHVGKSAALSLSSRRRSEERPGRGGSTKNAACFGTEFSSCLGLQNVGSPYCQFEIIGSRRNTRMARTKATALNKTSARAILNMRDAS